MSKKTKDHKIANKRNKESVVSFDLPLDVHDELTKMAKLAGVTFNQLIRVILMMELTKVKINPPTPPATTGDLNDETAE